jgi:hypothetical protein
MAMFSPRCRHRRQRRANRRDACARPQRVSRGRGKQALRWEGICAAAARSLAGVAEPDAAALSGAAGLMLWRSFSDSSARAMLITP